MQKNYYQVYFPAVASAFIYAESEEEARQLVQTDVDQLGYERLTALATPQTETLKPKPFGHIAMLQYWPENCDDPLPRHVIDVELVAENEEVPS